MLARKFQRRYKCSCIQTEHAVGILEGPVLRKRNQFGARNQLTKRVIEICILEGFSSIADHDCAMNAIQIEFLGQIWMNEKRGRAIVSSQPFPRTLSGCKDSLSLTPRPSLARRCKTICFVMPVVLVTKRMTNPVTQPINGIESAG